MGKHDLDTWAIAVKCPTCGTANDAVSSLSNDHEERPSAGDITVCLRCGEALVFTSDDAAEICAEVPAEVAVEVKRAQHAIRSMRYNEAATACLEAVRHWKAYAPDEPLRFRLPPKEIAIIADLESIASRIALSPASYTFVIGLCRFYVLRNTAAPTVMMLQHALEMASIEIERVSLADLGLIDADARVKS